MWIEHSSGLGLQFRGKTGTERSPEILTELGPCAGAGRVTPGFATEGDKTPGSRTTASSPLRHPARSSPASAAGKGRKPSARCTGDEPQARCPPATGGGRTATTWHGDKGTISFGSPEPQIIVKAQASRTEREADGQSSRSLGASRSTPRSPRWGTGHPHDALGAPSQGYRAAPLRLLPYLCCRADSGSSCGLYF